MSEIVSEMSRNPDTLTLVKDAQKRIHQVNYLINEEDGINEQDMK